MDHGGGIVSPVQEPGWLQGLRRKGEKDLARLGLPDHHDEDWKHLTARELLPVTTAVPSHELASLATEFAAPEAWAVMVFVGGIFHPDLSRIPEPSRDWNVEALSRAIDIRSADVISRLGYADPADHALMSLNLERWSDGLFLRVPDWGTLPGPVQILEVGSGSSWLRNLLVLGEGARATILETHVSPDDLVTSSHTVTESVLSARAALEHVRVQRGGSKARAWNALATRIDSGARLESRHFAVGGALARVEIHADLDAPGASVAIDGLAAANGATVSDALTSVRHRAKDCTSTQVWKALAQDHGMTNFVGNLIVEKGADGTEARQSNRNILLSRDAAIHSRPQLEIWADEVKCSHGSATGKLDEKALFFLRSRGLSSHDARRVLVRAFAEEILAPVPWESVRQDISRLVEGRI